MQRTHNACKVTTIRATSEAVWRWLHCGVRPDWLDPKRKNWSKRGSAPGQLALFSGTISGSIVNSSGFDGSDGTDPMGIRIAKGFNPREVPENRFVFLLVLRGLLTWKMWVSPCTNTVGFWYVSIFCSEGIQDGIEAGRLWFFGRLDGRKVPEVSAHKTCSVGFKT